MRGVGPPSRRIMQTYLWSINLNTARGERCYRDSVDHAVMDAARAALDAALAEGSGSVQLTDMAPIQLSVEPYGQCLRAVLSMPPPTASPLVVTVVVALKSRCAARAWASLYEIVDSPLPDHLMPPRAPWVAVYSHGDVPTQIEMLTTALAWVWHQRRSPVNQ